MAAKPSPSWTFQALCKMLSACCVVQCWIHRDLTAALNHTSTPNTTFSFRRSAQATRHSCEYRWQMFFATAIRSFSTTFIIYSFCICNAVCVSALLSPHMAFGRHNARPWIRYFTALWGFDMSSCKRWCGGMFAAHQNCLSIIKLLCKHFRKTAQWSLYIVSQYNCSYVP